MLSSYFASLAEVNTSILQEERLLQRAKRCFIPPPLKNIKVRPHFLPLSGSAFCLAEKSTGVGKKCRRRIFFLLRFSFVRAKENDGIHTQKKKGIFPDTQSSLTLNLIP